MKKHIILICTTLLLSIVSCDKFLDKLPDNRAEVDTEMEIEKILVYAYPQTSYILLSEDRAVLDPLVAFYNRL